MSYILVFLLLKLFLLTCKIKKRINYVEISTYMKRNLTFMVFYWDICILFFSFKKWYIFIFNESKNIIFIFDQCKQET